MNLLLIISDTLRHDFLGCYGNTWIRTPYIDRLAQDALLFERCYLSSFPTVPARRDFLTGRFSASYSPWQDLPADEVVLPDCLRPADYVSMMVTDLPFLHTSHYDRGFDGSEWIRGQWIDQWKAHPTHPDPPGSQSYLSHAAWRLGEYQFRLPRQAYMRALAHRRSEEDYFAPRTMTTAARWLEAYRMGGETSPFFLYADTWDPHEPWDPPVWYGQLYAPEYDGLSVFATYDRSADLSEIDLRRMIAAYAGEVTMVDRWIGHLVQRVDDLGYLEDTAIVITADHGFLHGEHGYLGKSLFTRDDEGRRFGSAWLPLYDEIAHVPLIVRLPGGRRGRTRALVQLADVMPTLLDIAGADAPPTVHGRSFKPVLSGESDAHRDMTLSFPTLVYGGHAGASIAVNTDQWSYICSGRPLEVGADERTRAIDDQPKVFGEPDRTGDELYDAASDRRQETNIIAAHADVGQFLRKEVQAALRRLGTAAPIVSCWDGPFVAHA